MQNESKQSFVGFDGQVGDNHADTSAGSKTVLDSCKRCGKFRSVPANKTRLCKDCVWSYAFISKPVTLYHGTKNHDSVQLLRKVSGSYFFY